MRFVELRIEPDRLADFERFYEETISPALHETAGCLFAGLMNRHGPTEECISMTLWQSPEDARRYEESGLYEKLLDEAESMISNSSEWRIRLSDDLTLEYKPIKVEPVVTASPIESASSAGAPTGVDTGETYLRIVSARVQPGKFEELAAAYDEKIIPALTKVDGCRYAYLVRGMKEADMALSITLWDSQEQAERYENSGRFAELLALAKPMFSELLQWKMSLSQKKRDRTATSDDMSVEGYHIVASDSFSSAG